MKILLPHSFHPESPVNKIAAVSMGLAFIYLTSLPGIAQYHQNSHQQSRRVSPQYRHVKHSQNHVRPAGVSIQGSTGSYQLDAGDIVSTIVHGVLGDFQSAPIHWPGNGNQVMPGIGYPVPVRDDGAVHLPLIDPVNVRGLTVIQAEDAIEQAYLDAGVLKGKNLVTCHLMRKRTVQVKVVHNRYPRRLQGENSLAISSVNLPADDATPLRALAEAGGFFDSNNIEILRQTSSQSMQLTEGDIVNAPLPEPGFFYAGGLLNPGRYEIPMGGQINALQAMAQSGGRVLGRSGFGPSELILTRGNQSLSYNVNWLVNNPNALIIQPGDTITVRETPADIIGNAAIDILQFQLLRGF